MLKYSLLSYSQRDDVQGIEDALRHLTKPETVQVVSRGRTVDATKQVFIESLPPILIIHLKRFIYDGYDVQKSNKVLLYQTSLEIPNGA
jgi:ubiquitin carboxyl-terminal hydrolase 10